MSQPHRDTLSRPPFFAIPGVDATAPIPTQMEQIDQLNTLLLQEIDANFARLHATVTTRILPEIKRFAIASQPTREAAAFWANFYSQAFGERPGEGSTVGDVTAGDGDGDGDETARYDATRYERFEPTRYDDTSSGGSFFDPAATSTPMKGRKEPGLDSISDDESLGSPFDRVDRQLSRLSFAHTESDEPTPSLPSGYGYSSSGESPSPEFDSTLRFDPSGAATPRARALPDPDSPTAHRSPATRLIDLTSTPLGTDFRVLAPSAGRSLFSRPAPIRPQNTSHASYASSSHTRPRSILDDDDDIKLGMSPPVTMKFALPPAAQRIVTAGTTPMKAPTDDLMDLSYEYEPSPRMPTPENLRRYSLAAHDLAADLAEARRAFDAPVDASAPAPPPTARRLFEPEPTPRGDTQAAGLDESTYGFGRPRRSIANTSYGSDIEIQRDVTGRIIGDDESIDDDGDDSLDDTAGYAAQAAQGFEFVDNSYDSDLSGYPGGADYRAHGAHEETEAGETSLFGRPAPGAGRQFALHQQDEMVTYHGGRLEDAAAPDSPTRRR